MTFARLSVVSLLVVLTITGCTGPFKNNLPPAQMLMEPGPGVGGPGPGITMYQPTPPSPDRSSQVAFAGPEGMMVTWDVGMPGLFDSEPLICPGRYNFPQGAIYRLKMTNIPGREGVELYPTLEVGPAMPRTEAFLAHNAIPIQFTEEDLDQVMTGNFVTKVIYLPDPEFQALAIAGVETLVSTRLDPGVDPIVEADRRGAILAVVRLGGIDLQIPGELAEQAEARQAAYQAQAEGQPMVGGPRPMGAAPHGGGTTMPTRYISGVTSPQYGMPMCGTPIGLPGPPHVPLGGPAGLRKHVIKNHTFMNIPKPTRRVRLDVRQQPGFSYPKPANHAFIVEQTLPGFGLFRQPHSDKREVIRSDCGSAAPY